VTWIARSELELLPAPGRATALADLRATIDERLAGRDEQAYWLEVRAIVEELRAAGHDLWHHDTDGERRDLWGWDYMRLATAGFLQIQFDIRSRCQTFWRTEDGRLGVDRGDES
jgi:hypothetical protein